jgi:hypothetical protein
VRPIILGITTFLASVLALVSMLGPVTCRDGWHSHSIGQRGACSHHGGVGGGLHTLAIFGSAGLGIWVGVLAYRRDQAKLERARRERWEKHEADIATRATPRQVPEPIKISVSAPAVAPTPLVACPICGSAMRLRRAKRGKRSGKRFWGCSRYPACRGTKNVSA